MQRNPRPWRRRWRPLLALLLPACASRQLSPPRQEHEHGNAMITLQIMGDRVAPAPDVSIPLYSAVCWLNSDPNGNAIEIALDRTPGVCGRCATILGFATTPDGVASTTAKIAPQSVALICFHETGEFRYTVRGSPQPLNGTIRVAEAKRTQP